MNNTVNFIIAVIFKGWKALDAFISIVLSVIVLFLPPECSLEYKIFFIVIILISAFILKILRQSYTYYLEFLRPIKVIKKVEGDGLYKGVSVIVLENPGYLRDNTLLTLFSKSSGAKQPVCILRVIESIGCDFLITIQLSPTEKEYKIDKYFNEDSRLKSLYALPLINYNELYKSESLTGGQNE